MLDARLAISYLIFLLFFLYFPSNLKPKGKNLRASLQNIGMQMGGLQGAGGGAAGAGRPTMSPRKSIASKPSGPGSVRLRPLVGVGTRKNSIATTVTTTGD